MGLSVNTFGDLGDLFLADTFAEFKHDIVINDLVEASDGQGGFNVTPALFASVEAFVFPKKGTEKPGADGAGTSETKLTTMQKVIFQLKPVSGVTTKMQIVHNSEEYQIRSIVDIADVNQWMKIEAERVGLAQ